MEWNLRKAKTGEKDKIKFIDDMSLSNFKIRKGINYLIGKNNSGKSKILDSLNNETILISEGEMNIDVNKTYFRTESKYIEDENTSGKQISRNSLNKFINIYGTKREEITENIFSNIGDNRSNDLLENFIKGKKIFQLNEFKPKIDVEIDGVNSKDSGSGENRILYMLYTMANTINAVDEIYYELINDWNIVIKFANDKYKDDNDFIGNIEEFIDFCKNYQTGYSNTRSKARRTISRTGVEITDFIQQEGAKQYIELLEKLLVENGISSARLCLMPFIKSFFPIFQREDERSDVEAEKFKNLIIEILQTNENESNFTIGKETIISDYWKVMLGQTDNISLRFLILIDEPELYIHSSKFLLVNKIIERMSNLNKDEYDVRIVISTHDERILKNPKGDIFNTNIVYKEDSLVRVKNVFDNDPIGFIGSIKNSYNEEFKAKRKDKMNDNEREKIDRDMQSLSPEFLQWFITSKDNLKIFFSDDCLIVEGFHDKLIIESLQEKNLSNWKSTSVIETDGTYLGILVWLEIIKRNSNHFKMIEILIDADMKHGDNPKFKAQTYLLRRYVEKVSEELGGKITLYSSLFNDITQWAYYEKRSSEWLGNNRSKIKEKFGSDDRLIKSENRNDAFEWCFENSVEYFEDLYQNKNFKDEFQFNYDKYLFSKKFSRESVIWIIGSYIEYLFNKKPIYKNVIDYVSDSVNTTPKNQDYIIVEDGKIKVQEYLIDTRNDEYVVDTSPNIFSERVIIARSDDPNEWLTNYETTQLSYLIIDINKMEAMVVDVGGVFPVTSADGGKTDRMKYYDSFKIDEIKEHRKIKGLYKIWLNNGKVLFVNINDKLFTPHNVVDTEKEDIFKLLSIEKNRDFRFIGYKTFWVESNYRKENCMIDSHYYVELFENHGKGAIIGPFKKEIPYEEAIDEIMNSIDEWVKIN